LHGLVSAPSVHSGCTWLAAAVFPSVENTQRAFLCRLVSRPTICDAITGQTSYNRLLLIYGLNVNKMQSKTADFAPGAAT